MSIFLILEWINEHVEHVNKRIECILTRYNVGIIQQWYKQRDHSGQFDSIIGLPGDGHDDLYAD